MKNRNIALLGILFSLAILQSCQDTAEEETFQNASIKFPLVADELKPYFQRFEDEGNKLGVEVDLTAAQIGGSIQTIKETNVVGQSINNHRDPVRIVVDSAFWQNASDITKEFVIFHELGHSYLRRDHLEKMMDNGNCVSIMRSGLYSCHDNYTAATRDYYVNELFFPQISAPELLTARTEAPGTCSFYWE